MAKFKVGDRVRFTGYDSESIGYPIIRPTETEDGNRKGEIRPGMIGVVLENNNIPFVKWDNFTEGHNKGDGQEDCSNWAIVEEDMELI